MANQTTEHFTGTGEILFMAAGRALLNKKTGKEEYSIKLRLKKDDQAVKHLQEIADYKIDTKTNRANANSDSVIVNFTSSFAPIVADSEGALEADQIPRFDGRTDTGTAAVVYKVVDFGDKKIVRLAGIKLKDLKLAEKSSNQDKGGLDVTLKMLNDLK